jgi:hypothetical protein
VYKERREGREDKQKGHRRTLWISAIPYAKVQRGSEVQRGVGAVRIHTTARVHRNKAVRYLRGGRAPSR